MEFVQKPARRTNAEIKHIVSMALLTIGRLYSGAFEENDPVQKDKWYEAAKQFLGAPLNHFDCDALEAFVNQYKSLTGYEA